MERKNFLKTLAVAAAAGPMVFNSCKKNSAESTTSTTTASGATTTTGSCITTPTEEEGPFPYPGGEITNPLLRSDITGGQTGVPITFNLLLLNTATCNVITGARVDIWHCNKDGYYSGYSGQSGGTSGLATSYVGETWLRGYQSSDSAGAVKFMSIFPGWYYPRATHIHLEIFIGGVLKKQTQLAFSKAIADAVHITSLYKAHGVNTTLNANDNVFGNSATDLANETLTITGDVTNGYVATYTIGIAI